MCSSVEMAAGGRSAPYVPDWEAANPLPIAGAKHAGHSPHRGGPCNVVVLTEASAACQAVEAHRRGVTGGVGWVLEAPRLGPKPISVVSTSACARVPVCVSQRSVFRLLSPTPAILCVLVSACVSSPPPPPFLAGGPAARTAPRYPCWRAGLVVGLARGIYKAAKSSPKPESIRRGIFDAFCLPKNRPSLAMCRLSSPDDICHLRMTKLRIYIQGYIISTTHILSQGQSQDGPSAHPRTKIGTQIWSQCECTPALQRLSTTAHTPPVLPSALVGVRE